MIAKARAAQKSWQTTTMEERATICRAFVDALCSRTDEIAREITMQMGRPIAQTPGELRGFAERANYMIGIAQEVNGGKVKTNNLFSMVYINFSLSQALADTPADPLEGYERFIRRVPLGVVLTIAAWNYPLLTAVNSVVPAIMAGNALLLKQVRFAPSP